MSFQTEPVHLKSFQHGSHELSVRQAGEGTLQTDEDRLIVCVRFDIFSDLAG